MLIYDQHSIQGSPASEVLKPVLCPSFLALQFPKTLRDVKMRKVAPVHISCSYMCSYIYKYIYLYAINVTQATLFSKHFKMLIRTDSLYEDSIPA